MSEDQKIVEQLKKELQSLADSQGLSEDSVEFVYRSAMSMWKNRQAKTADQLFQVLFPMSPNNARYTESMAHFYYDQEQYDKALFFYSYAGVSGLDQATAMFYVARCHMMMGESDMAYTMFNYVVEGSVKDPSFAPDASIIGQAKLMLFALKSKKEKEAVPAL